MEPAKRLIFITEPAHIDQVSNRLLASCRIIAVTPQAAFALDQRSLSYTTPEDYIGLDQINRIGNTCNETFDEFMDAVFSYITHPFFVAHPLSNFYFFQRLYTTINVAVKTLSAIIENEQPKEIIYAPNLGGNDERNEEFIYWKKSLFSILLPHFAGQCIITPLFNVDVRPPVTPQIAYNRISPKVFTQIVPWNIKQKAQYNVLFLDLKYNLPYLIDVCRNKDECSLFALDLYTPNTWEIFFSSHDTTTNHPHYIVFRDEMRLLWQNLSHNSSFRSIFSVDDIDVWDAFKPHIEHFITDSLPKSYVIYHTISQHHSATPLDCIVSSFTVPFAHTIETIFNWAHHMDVPTITYQHGGGFGYVYRQAHNRTDFHLPDYFFGFGNGVKQYAQKHRLRSRVIPVGAPMIEEHTVYASANAKSSTKISGFNPGKKTVGYISTGFHGVIHHNPGDIYPDHVYFETQKKIFDLFTHTPDTQFIVKTYPKAHSQITKDYLLNLNAPNIFIVDCPVKELHSLVDVYVLDFISTIMLQAIAANKPIVMFYNQLTCPIEPEALELLRKRIHYAESFEQFTENFNSILASSHDPLCENNEFYTAYIAPQLDGKSALRAYDALIDICANNNRSTPHYSSVTIGSNQP